MSLLQPVALAYLLLAVAPFSATPPEGSTAEAEILTFFETYAARANALEWDELLALYADDPRFRWLESGELAYDGKESVVEHVRTLAPLIERLDFEVLEPRVLVLSAEHAHASLRFRESLTLVSGETLELEGAITALLIHTDQGWRLLSGHTSISPPA